jgi:putative DNA primase/helicase
MTKYRKAYDFSTLNRRCCANWQAVTSSFAPTGVMRGREYQTRNPHRTDGTLGSFSINVHTGHWADFATGDKGGDWISWVAFMRSVNNGQAARLVAELVRE